MMNRIKVLASIASGALVSLYAAGAFAQSAAQGWPVGQQGSVPAQAQVAPTVAAAGTTLPVAQPTAASGSAATPPAAFAEVQIDGQPQSPAAQAGGSPVVVGADGSQAAASDGQWVYLKDRGWTWVPGEGTTVAANEEPYVYVYTPSVGWNWVVSPWGWGPYYYGPWATAYGPGFWGGYYHYGAGAWGGWHGGYGRGWGGGGYRGGGWGGGGVHGGGYARSAPGGGGHSYGGGSRAAQPHYSSPGGGHFGSFRGGGGGGHFGGHGGGHR
jgi:hypothetical protein